MSTNLANILIGLVKSAAAPTLSVAVSLFTLTLTAQEWQPEILSDGQPNITGMWNNVGATATPLEMPNQFEGRVPNQEELAEFIKTRDEARKGAVWDGFENSRGVGAYENYWFDWYWSDAQADAPSLIVNPPNGLRPAFTEEALTQKRFNVEHEHGCAAKGRKEAMVWTRTGVRRKDEKVPWV